MSSQTLLTPSLITKETLVMLENNLVAAGKVNRQFENQFVKIGNSITVRKPSRFTVTSGAGLSVQDINEQSTSITISNQKHVDFQFTSQDLTLTVEEFSDRYLKPAAAALANQIDYDVIGNFTSVYNWVGTAGTTPSSFATSVQLVGQRMDEGAVPQDGRTLMLNPAAHWKIANGLSSLYVRSVAEPALKGYLAAIGNFEVYMDQNIQSQTTGTYTGTPTVSAGSQTGATVTTAGWTASTDFVNVGDVVTLAGCHAVNPQNRQSTGSLQNFVITQKTTADGSGNMTLHISPSITTSGAYQTVDASPTNSGAVSVVSGTSAAANPQNLAFVRDCFALVTVPLEIPQGVDFAARETYKNISMRVVRAYDINNDVFPCRIDVLYGTACYYPELGVRLSG